MLSTGDIIETINMIREENLDIRTVTMGISLIDCAGDDVRAVCDRIYSKITRLAEKLVPVSDGIEKQYGIPIVNRRIAVTPVSLIGGRFSPDDYIRIAETLDRAACDLGVNFIGGYGALVQKGSTVGEDALIESIPYALASTARVCSSVNVASTKAGINMDAVIKMGGVIKKTAELTASTGSFGCAKIVVFANVPEDNP